MSAIQREIATPWRELSTHPAIGRLACPYYLRPHLEEFVCGVYTGGSVQRRMLQNKLKRLRNCWTSRTGVVAQGDATLSNDTRIKVSIY